MTSGADQAPLDAAKATVPARFEQPPPADHPAIAYGFVLYDAGFHWECHEVLEAVWMATAQNSRERLALRALIQLANAGLKHRMGRHRAVRRLLGEAAALLAELGPERGEGDVADSIAARRLVPELRDALGAVEAGCRELALPRLGWMNMQESA